MNGFEGRNQCDRVWPTFIPKFCYFDLTKQMDLMGGFVGYRIHIKVSQYCACNQTVECDWQPQVTSPKNWTTKWLQVTSISFLTFCVCTTATEKSSSQSSGRWHGVSTKKTHSVPVFQAPWHGVIALSLCRLQWVREGQRSPTVEGSQCIELGGFGYSEILAYSCFGLII